jgi:hypothetical protein
MVTVRLTKRNAVCLSVCLTDVSCICAGERLWSESELAFIKRGDPTLLTVGDSAGYCAYDRGIAGDCAAG